MTEIKMPTKEELRRQQYENNWDLVFKGKVHGYRCKKNENRDHDFQLDMLTSKVACINCGVCLN